MLNLEMNALHVQFCDFLLINLKLLIKKILCYEQNLHVAHF